MSEKLFNIVLFRNGEVVGSQVLFLEENADFEDHIQRNERVYQADKSILFKFNESNNSYEIMPKLEKKFFHIDGWNNLYQGYTQGKYWNGWSCPMFPLDVAKRLVEMELNTLLNKAWYDEEKDSFIIQMDGEEEEYASHTIKVNGEELKVYSIGSGGWVWEEYDKPVEFSGETIDTVVYDK